MNYTNMFHDDFKMIDIFNNMELVLDCDGNIDVDKTIEISVAKIKSIEERSKFNCVISSAI